MYFLIYFSNPYESEILSLAFVVCGAFVLCGAFFLSRHALSLRSLNPDKPGVSDTLTRL